MFSKIAKKPKELCPETQARILSHFADVCRAVDERSSFQAATDSGRALQDAETVFRSTHAKVAIKFHRAKCFMGKLPLPVKGRP